MGHSRRMSRPLSAALALVLVLGLGLACDDRPPPDEWNDTGDSSASTSTTPEKPKAVPLKAEKPAKAEPRLPDEAFEESATNRDPFRSFVYQLSTTGRTARARQRRVLMKRYGLDELKLIAVVVGSSTRPMAMFKNPKGLGVTVKRGDYISKSEARVKQILRDKVIVELEERSEDRIRRTDRMIMLHPKDENLGLE